MHRLIKIRFIRDFERLEERVRRWLETPLELEVSGASFRPAVDFYETAAGLVLRLEVAGVAQEDLSIFLAGQELIIRGRRQPPAPEGARRILHLEMPFGAFERTFKLPIPIEPQGAQAQYRDGILEIHLPRKKLQTRQISVTEEPEHE